MVARSSGAQVSRYRIAGLLVASDMPLPGAAPADGDAPAEVTIRSGDVPSVLEAPTAVGPTWRLAGTTLLLDIPDVGRLRIEGGGEIVYQSDAIAPADDLAVFLAGPVLALLLDLRRQPVLRASGVWVEGRAVLFCGPSGSGKSTLAAALTQRGYPLLLDDVCAVTLAVPPLIQSDATWLKLWSRPIERLGLDGRRGDRVRACLEKHYLDPGAARAAPAPIGAVYNLREARPPHAAGIEAPNAVDAVLALRRSAYYPLMVQRLGLTDLYFRTGAAIAHAGSVFHLTRRLDLAALPETVSDLERHWSEIGLTKAAA
jgi:hypothetical protein